MIQPGKLIAAMALVAAAILSSPPVASAQAEAPSTQEKISVEQTVFYRMQDSTWG
ncbi:hypothetical protein ACFVH7_29530 [Kitasatospora indigofera]|uniref:hypothetical protein n=1 Tax=Kitasatospora indigofera TaxID=67307 RepID=UPI003644D9D2